MKKRSGKTEGKTEIRSEAVAEVKTESKTETEVKTEARAKSGKRRNIIVVLVAVAIITAPLILFRVLTENMVDDITQTISLQHSKELNAQMSANISNSVDSYFASLTTEYNALKLVDNLDEAELESFIADTKEKNGISYLAFADDEGMVYEEDRAYVGTMRMNILGKLLNGETRVVKDNETIGNDSYVMMGTYFDEPIMMGDRKICIAIMGMTNATLAEKVVLKSDYSEGYCSLIGMDGGYIIKNPSEPYAGLNMFSILKKSYQVSDEELQVLLQAIRSGETYLLKAQGVDSTTSVYMYFAPVENTNWYALNVLPSTFVGKSIAELEEFFATIYIIFIGVFLILAAIVILQESRNARELQESQIELEKALKLAREASNAKTAFLFNMSHDIRTPMNAILGYTDIGLTHAGDAARAQDSFRKIKTSGDHLLSLINDILEMSRIEAGRLELNEQEMDMLQAIDSITTMSETLALPKSIDFQTIIGNIPNPYIYADELHTNEIIINLISNAVKYTPNGGRVRYTINQISDVADGKATYRFEISDTGIGMSAEFQEHLFEAFSRETRNSVSKIEGAGLGLSIVKKIVDIAGGTIRVNSVLHEGSTFIVELPFRVMSEAEAESFREANKPVEEPVGDANLEGKRILLVEDNEINREVATMILEDAGLLVETAEDGQVSVDRLTEKGMEYYDFVLMDIQMPIMNGYEAAAAIRKMPDGDKVKIIALSANAFEEDKKQSIACGMNAHVAKPIDMDVLLETMNSLQN